MPTTNSIDVGNRRAQQAQRLFERRLQGDHRAALALLAAEGEDLAHEVGGAAATLHDLLDVAHRLAVALQALAEQVGETQDRGQDVVEVVRDAAGEGADGLHLLRPQELRFEVIALRFGTLALGDVDRDAEHRRGAGAREGERDLGRLHEVRPAFEVGHHLFVDHRRAAAADHLAVFGEIALGVLRRVGDALDRSRQHALDRGAVELGDGAVDDQEAALAVLGEDEVRHEVDHLAQAPFALAQSLVRALELFGPLRDARFEIDREGAHFLLGELEVGHVLGDAGDAVDLPGRVLDRERALADPSLAAVRARDAIELVVAADDLARGGARQHALAVLRHDRLEPGGGPPVELGERTLPDGLVGGARVEHGALVGRRHPEHLIDVLGELPEALLAFAQRVLGFSALGALGEQRHEMRHRDAEELVARRPAARGALLVAEHALRLAAHHDRDFERRPHARRAVVGVDELESAGIGGHILDRDRLRSAQRREVALAAVGVEDARG
jgi:hypothetical protein